MAIDLFDECDAGADEGDLSKIEINKDFARRLEHNKKREALQKYEELKKRGLAAASSSDEGSDDDSDESSDEVGGPVDSSKVDRQFFETLVRVKNKDPILERKDAKLYSSGEDDEEEPEKLGATRKERPLYLKDVMARHLIEEGPEFGEKRLKDNPKVYNKEQEENIKALLEAGEEAFGSDDDDDIIKEKQKAGEEMDGEDEVRNQCLDAYFGKEEELDEDDLFLKNFFRHRWWVDKDKGKKPSFDDVAEVSEDEDELDRQDLYEAKYNFRHEEGQADRVLGHSRVVEGSVRKKTSSRKAQRKSKEERMAQAEFERKEELKHLKNLKKKEIQEKLEKIWAVAGFDDDAVCKLGADDLEEDFDPEEYDKKMREMFDVDYYEAEDADPDFGSDGESDLEKPDFEKEDELLGLPKAWDEVGSNEGFEAARKRGLKRKEEEPLEETQEIQQEEEGKRKKKKQQKTSLKEKVELDKELEEYYKLDYEDTIGDLKTRFKYKSVPGNRYGLRPEEILFANDTDLNQYVSLKKLAPYRENEWKVTYHRKSKKSLILQGEMPDPHKTGKMKKSKGVSSSEEPATDKRKIETEGSNDEVNQLSRRIRRRRRQAELKLSQSRLMAYGKIPIKSKKRH